jgi:hypothetical protein
MGATKTLWLASGKPDPRKPIMTAEGPCYWCGSRIVGEACRVNDVYGSSFTDHDVATVATSSWVCVPCAWSMTGRPPDTLRLWSLVYREDRPAAPSHEKAPRLGSHIHLQNKADPSEFDAVLRDPPSGPWICAVADSGQIHVIPFARVNHGRRWCVRFERHDVRSSSDEYSRIADAMQALYDAGYSKDDIATGSPSPGRLLRAGVDLWRENDKTLRRYRGGPLFELALFLRRRVHND